MKFCPECSTRIRSDTVNYCENCGYAINKESEKEYDLLIEQVEGSRNTVYTLGVRLEQMVAQILTNKGFDILLRQKVRGKSGAMHEIDIIAKRDGRVIAVECKNYGESRSVGIKEIRDFHSKILDLTNITSSMFITNIGFTSNVQDYASHHDIQLWDGERLQHDFYLLNLGRLDTDEDILIGNSLPVTIDYTEASKVSLVNPTFIEARGQLIFRPYYLFEYELDMRKGLLGRQRIRESGEVVMDAVSHKILQDNMSKSSPKSSPKDMTYIFLSKIHKENSESNDLLSGLEQGYVLHDIKNIRAEKQYTMSRSMEYAITKLDTKIPINAGERIVTEYLIQIKKAKYHEIKIKSSLIYVPTWLVVLNSNKTSYVREILAASKHVLKDEISLCPTDLSSRFRSQSKMTYAVCVICGQAYCKNHMFQKDDLFFCGQHNYRSGASSTIIPEKSSSDKSHTIETSLTNVHDSLEAFIDNSIN